MPAPPVARSLTTQHRDFDSPYDRPPGSRHRPSLNQAESPSVDRSELEERRKNMKTAPTIKRPNNDQHRPSGRYDMAPQTLD